MEPTTNAWPCPRIVPGQERLTPEQEAYAQQFVEEWIAAMLTPSVKEELAEEELLQAYEEELILHPEQLSREDWVNEKNVEIRRVIQERMPDFVEQIGGRFLDLSTRGCLYAIDLGEDSEKVAHYVQVSDPSTKRWYYLRVPPTITSADEAVAWTFGLSEQKYQPGQET